MGEEEEEPDSGENGCGIEGAAPLVEPEDVDVVIPTIRNVDFLESWRAVLGRCHIIVIQDGEPSAARRVRPPDGFDCEVFDRRDIECALGDRASCISFRDSACRCFGWLASRRRYVYTLDDDCYLPPESAMNASRHPDPLTQHLLNLATPSTPHYFNTLYDPFREGADFVRGYPFSLRDGVPTAISHGLWLNVPDYDAPTQLVKPAERNARAVDAVMTIPHGTLYPMCGMNLAFDRATIGPAMYFGLMGDGQPIGRYDDMWAGWCSKVICDHLGYGVKSGLPYVWHSRASNPFANMRKEHKGVFWQEKLVPFFRGVHLSSGLRDAAECYLELAELVRVEMGRVDSYFGRLADAMVTWIEAWRITNTTGGVC